jgi:hypothetical protein
MKYSLIPTLAIVSLMISCSGGSADLNKTKLKGHVKSVKEQQFHATYKNDQWVVGKEVAPVYKLTTFDEEGYYVNVFHIGEEGDTLAKQTCKRKNGNIVEENFLVLHSRQLTRTIMERVSDEQINFEVYTNGQLAYEGAIYFDSKGRILRQIQVVEDRQVMVHNVYKKDLLMESYQEERMGQRSATRHYEYPDFDEKGNWSTRLVFMEEDKITPKYAITREIAYY